MASGPKKKWEGAVVNVSVKKVKDVPLKVADKQESKNASKTTEGFEMTILNEPFSTPSMMVVWMESSRAANQIATSLYSITVA